MMSYINKLLSGSMVAIFTLASCNTVPHETIEEKQARKLQFMVPPLVLIAKNANWEAMVRDKHGTIIIYDNTGIGRLLGESYDVGDTIVRATVVSQMSASSNENKLMQ